MEEFNGKKYDLSTKEGITLFRKNVYEYADQKIEEAKWKRYLENVKERDRRRKEKKELEDKGWLGRVFYEARVIPEEEEAVIEDALDLSEWKEGTDFAKVEEERTCKPKIDEAIISDPNFVELEDVIEARKDASEELREFAQELNNETSEIEVLKNQHYEWIIQYLEETGGQAIWKGVITKGFRIWCAEKGYKLGDSDTSS